MKCAANERRLISSIWSIVSEAQVSIQAANDKLSLPPRSELCDGLTREALKYLAVSIVEIHAKMFKHCNSVWPIMSIVGNSLDRYGQFLKADIV